MFFLYVRSSIKNNHPMKFEGYGSQLHDQPKARLTAKAISPIGDWGHIWCESNIFMPLKKWKRWSVHLYSVILVQLI